jgi:hypothetical protein
MGRRWRSWLRHCATFRKVAGSISSGRTMALGSTQPLTEMNTSIISWGKGGRCIALTFLPPSCANCHKNWELRPPGTLRASTRIALPYVIHRRKIIIKNHSNTNSDVTLKRNHFMVTMKTCNHGSLREKPRPNHGDPVTNCSTSVTFSLLV